MADEERAAPEAWFIPILLWAGAAWFGYDIVTNAEAYQEWPNFNRGGFALLSVGAIYTTWRAVKETRAAREGDDDTSAGDG
jgi:hypothetical protein